MAARVGEMMVVIRAQDFASRTLRRVSAEMAGMSREQQLMQRQMRLAARVARQTSRIDAAEQHLRGAKALQRYGEAMVVHKRRLADMNDLQERVNQAQRGGMQFFPQTRALVRDLALAQQAVDKSQRGLDRYTRFINDKLPSSFQRFKRSLDSNLSRGLIDINREVTRSANVLRQLHPELALLRNDLDVVNHAIRQLPMERLDRVAHAMSGVGRTMQLFGAVGTAAFGLAASQAANFNTEISLAATQARDIDAPISQVHTRIEQLSEGFTQNGKHIKGVLDLMQQYPATSQEMTAATYDIFSSMNLEEGKIMDVAKGMRLLEDANKIAVAGGGSLEEATQAMITVLNNFDPQLKNTTENFDTMFDIVRFGRMRLGDFNTMMNKIAPAAADAGNTLEDVGGAMAFLTTVMPSQRMVATGISRLMEALRHPDIVKGLKMFGVNAKTATGQLRPLDELLKDIAEKFPEMRTGAMSAADFFREVSAAGRGGKSKGVIFTQEGRRALSQIITHMDQYLNRQRQIDRNTNEFNASLKAQQQALGVQWATFRNQLSALVLQIGTDAIPAFQEIGRVVSKVLDAWKSLGEGTREAIVRWGVFLSVGSLVGGVLLSIIGSALAAEAMIRRLAGSVGTATSAMQTMGVLLRRFAAIGLITLLFKVSIDGPPGWMDLASGGILGAILGKKWGRMAMLRGAIIIPVFLEVSGGGLDKPTKKLDEALVRWGRKTQEGDGLFGTGFGKGLGVLARWIGEADAKMQGFDLTTKKNTSNFKASNEQVKAGKKILADWAAGTAEADQKAKNTTNTWSKYRAAVQKFNEEMGTFQEATRRHKEDLDRWNDSLRDATLQAKKTAVDNLRSMYMEMESANRQAFGTLFQGPWLTSETFDIAKEWGITPRIEDMIKDLNQQNNQFAQWRSRLDKLMKRGVPREFIDEIAKMGIEEGSPLIENMMTATPQQMSRLIAQWKRREGQIKSATKMDFVDEIERFRTAGGDMGNAIINGFQRANVSGWFDGWIKQKFPDAINAAVNQAIGEFKAQNPRPVAPVAPTAPARPAGATPRNPGGVGTAGPWTPTQTINNANTQPTFIFHFVSSGEKEQMVRQAAFYARNAFRGLF